MSMLRHNLSRKRTFHIENGDSSDSDVESSPVKRRRCNNKRNLSGVVSEVWQWVGRLNLKHYLKMAMFKGAFPELPSSSDMVDVEDEEVIDVEDDEDDVTVIDTKRGPSLHSPNRNNDQSKGRKNPNSQPLSSTPFAADYRPLYPSSCRLLNSETLPLKPVTGYVARYPTQQKPQLQNGNSIPSTRFAPVTSPGLDDIVLLDHDSSVDDLGLLSNVMSSGQAVVVNCQKMASPNRSLSHRGFKFGSVRIEEEEDSRDSVMSEDRLYSRAGDRCGKGSRSFTAHEVVRLQERAQYKLLLDKMVSGNSFNSPLPRNSQLQIEPTSEEPLLFGSHFKKETLQKPESDFLEKYYKPCRLLTSKVPVASKKVVEDEDVDDIQIIEEKLPVFTPSRPKSNFFSPDWIQDLKTTITAETENRGRIVAEQEKKIEHYRKRRDDKLAEEKRQLDLMRLSGATVSDVDVDEFPELTPEMVIAVESVRGNNTREVLVNWNNLELSGADINTLYNLTWLNDQVINFYLALVVERSNSEQARRENWPTVYSFNTFFYPGLKSRGESAMARWTRRVDIFSYDLIVVPLHLGMHWAMLVVDNRTKKIKYLDSMSTQAHDCLFIMRDYLVFEMKDKKKQAMNTNEYSLERPHKIPMQMNGSDCGMFALKYAEFLSRDADLTFSQDNMAYFRQRMVYECLTHQLF